MGVNSAIKLLNRTARKADDVVEAGARSMSKGNLIKGVGTQLTSNQTVKQKKMIANAGREAVQNIRNAPLKEAQNVVNTRTTQQAIDNMDEVAATWTRGGGSRGRGGNRGYNNRANYGNNNRRVNFNQNTKNINMGRNKDEILQRFNANQTKKSINNLNQNVEVNNRVYRNRAGAVGNDINNARFRDLDEAIGTDSNVRVRRAPWTINRRTANINDDVNDLRFRNLGDSNRNTRTSPWSNNVGQQEQVISQEAGDIFNTYSGMPISNQGPVYTNTMNESLNVRMVGNNMNRQSVETGNNTPNINTNQSTPDVNINQNTPKVEEPKFTGNTTQGDGSNPQFDFEGNTPEKADPLENTTRQKLGEGMDWKSIGGKAKEFFGGGFTDTYSNYKANGGDFMGAVKSAYTNEDNSLRMGRIAGSYMAAAAGVRVLSGGGVTKDRNGNNNLIGVPFI